MYCLMMDFNVFICSACAGIHREMNHKVKGISMCVFTDAELKDLAENGNAVSLDSVHIRAFFSSVCRISKKSL